MAEQESQGLLSPLLRHRRCRAAAKQIGNANKVLDLGGGFGHLASYLPKSVRYTCIDLNPPEQSKVNSDEPSQIFIKDNVVEPRPETTARLSQIGPFDAIAILALVEHLSEPGILFDNYLPFLSSRGVIVITTPHPRGRRLHDLLARIRLCSWDAADEHEKFLDKEAISLLSNGSTLNLSTYSTFLLGLNQMAVFGNTSEPK